MKSKYIFKQKPAVCHRSQITSRNRQQKKNNSFYFISHDFFMNHFLVQGATLVGFLELVLLDIRINKEQFAKEIFNRSRTITELKQD